jgi:hypothetical protein
LPGGPGRLGRLAEAPATRRLGVAELGRALERGRRRRLSSAKPRAARGRLQRRRDVLVGGQRGQRVMPDAPVGVLLAVKNRSKRSVGSLPLRQRRRIEHRGANQRVAKSDPVACGAHDPRCLRGLERLRAHPELSRRAHNRRHVARVIDRGDQEHRLRGGGKSLDPRRERGLHSRRERDRIG